MNTVKVCKWTLGLALGVFVTAMVCIIAMVVT